MAKPPLVPIHRRPSAPVVRGNIVLRARAAIIASANASVPRRIAVPGRCTGNADRLCLGAMDIEIVIEDHDTYTRPIRYVQPQVLLPGAELIEYVCAENAKPMGGG